MNRSKNTVHAPALSALVASAFAFALASGCSSGQGNGSAPTTGTYLADLSTDLGVCTVAHDTCMDAADGDVSKVDTCKAEASDCHDAVQAEEQQVHTAIRACATTARSCFMSTEDAGTAARMECGQQLRACVEMALPPPPPLPPCAAALKTCLSSTEDGGADARKACLSTFNSCVVASLPPCMHEFATCVEDRSEPPRACERQAAQCTQYRFTHDGGLPPAAGGTTGAGGAPSGGAPAGGPPGFGARPSLGGRPSFGGQTGFGGPPSAAGHPGFGGLPSVAGHPGFGGLPTGTDTGPRRP